MVNSYETELVITELVLAAYKRVFIAEIVSSLKLGQFFFTVARKLNALQRCMADGK